MAFRLKSARIVQDVCQQLLAAMFSDSAQGPAKAKPYDAAWIGEVIGFDLFSEMPLDVDPGKACDEQVQISRPENFAAERYAPRGSLLAALREFLATDHTLFVLVGRTGTDVFGPWPTGFRVNWRDEPGFSFQGTGSNAQPIWTASSRMKWLAYRR